MGRHNNFEVEVSRSNSGRPSGFVIKDKNTGSVIAQTGVIAGKPASRSTEPNLPVSPKESIHRIRDDFADEIDTSETTKAGSQQKLTPEQDDLSLKDRIKAEIANKLASRKSR